MEQGEPRRLVTKVARLYHTRGLRQVEIAERMHLSQPRVSRLLAQAEELGIVRNIVAVPADLNRDLEQALCRAYDIRDAHVVDSVDTDAEDLTIDLGHAAAPLVARALVDVGPGTVGFTSWSRTLRHMVEMLRVPQPAPGHIVEMLGDIGEPTLQQDVMHLTQRFATLTGARPAFLRVPGVVASPARRAALLEDPHVRAALGLLDDLDLALLGIGPCEVVGPLRPGDNYFTREQFDEAARAGAVGQICLRFLDASGSVVATPLDDLVVGVTHEQIRRARSRWAVAGGKDKYAILRAALTGGWLDRLVTDTATAEHLLEPGP